MMTSEQVANEMAKIINTRVAMVLQSAVDSIAAEVGRATSQLKTIMDQVVREESEKAAAEAKDKMLDEQKVLEAHVQSHLSVVPTASQDPQ